MNLVIDIGNTLVKYLVFNYTTPIKSQTSTDIDNNIVSDLAKQYNINKAIVSDVRGVSNDTIAELTKFFDLFIQFTHKTKTPLCNNYKTPETLGLDRLAAAVGAAETFPDNDVLVLDFGSALTIDYVDGNGNFWGGNISPGLSMRYKALNTFTGKLPLINPDTNITIHGRNTAEAINNGVINGMVFEVRGYINYYATSSKNLKVVGTGGDTKIFDNLLKNTIFVVENLVALGLNSILNYNA